MPAGRPFKKLETRKIEKLAAIGCTDEEIADVMDCSGDTLVRNYAEYLRKGRSGFKQSLRRLQYAGAKKGNITMQIWLGKQHLGQKDRTDVTSGGAPLRFGQITFDGDKEPAGDNGHSGNGNGRMKHV